jgi:ATP-dependent RNA helicase SUPV3L1/SUV3
LGQEYFKEIEDSLIHARSAFVRSSLLGEDKIRSVEEARLVLKILETIYTDIDKFVGDFPSLEMLFNKKYGSIEDLEDREVILEICFLDDCIFPENNGFPFYVDDKFSVELIQTYPDQFKDWLNLIKENHLNTLLQIKEKFDANLKEEKLLCQCSQCLSEFRSKLREELLKVQFKTIDDDCDKLQDILVEKKIEDAIEFVGSIKRKLEKFSFQNRHRLKRSSLNKIDAEVKNYFRDKFSSDSDAGKFLVEKLKAYSNQILSERNLKLDLISDAEYDRFFRQMGVGIWKPLSFYRKEFDRLTNSIMALKRKDISAGILQEYLGQFWLHAEARKKTRKFIYHMGPTNSGKTYHAIQALCSVPKGCYLAPLRLLATELYDTMNSKGVKTTLLTGEEVIQVEGCTHYSSTIEMAKLHEHFDCCVIDEIQMMSDSQRGWAWTRAVINIDADEVHLCGDHSVLNLVKEILTLTGDTLEIKEYQRMTELQVMPKTITLAEMDRGDTLIVFSRKNALKYKADLEKLDFKVSIVYGRLSPEVRREQARKFDEGETDIMVATDAISMGMNLPVKRIVFSALSKHIDNQEFPLTNSEIKQIAGRAGRFNRFPTGFVTTLQRVDNGIQTVQEALKHQLQQSTKAMVGPDLEIFKSVNNALSENSLPTLSLPEFLRLFNTMIFRKPFYCVDLTEMIELAEMVEEADEFKVLTDSDVFGFACAPVNLGLVEHVQYYVWLVNNFVKSLPIYNENIDSESDDIDYLETQIKCVELYQWLSRHFENRNFKFDNAQLLNNKSLAIEKLNTLLSEKASKRCPSCGVKLDLSFKFNICDNCFGQRRNNLRHNKDEKSFETKKPFIPRRDRNKKNKNSPAKAFLKYR